MRNLRILLSSGSESVSVSGSIAKEQSTGNETETKCHVVAIPKRSSTPIPIPTPTPISNHASTSPVVFDHGRETFSFSGANVCVVLFAPGDLACRVEARARRRTSPDRKFRMRRGGKEKGFVHGKARGQSIGQNLAQTMRYFSVAFASPPELPSCRARRQGANVRHLRHGTP